jgi:uncharacterized protein
MDAERDNVEKGLTRRRVLATAVGAAVVAALGRRSVMAEGPTSRESGGETRPVAFRVEPFDLKDVRLLDGEFLEAQKRDEKYLLALQPDRFLHNFRVNAGLQPKAAVYGGWESVETWADIRAQGQTLGHYLSACSMMYASTDNEEFKKRADYIAGELAECQEAEKTGLVCAFPDNAAQFENMQAGRPFVGVPWYTMHKILAGLRDANLYCGNAVALTVLVKLSDWAIVTTANLSDAQFQKMLGTEHGGMDEVLADVYALTGEKKYLVLSERFCHRAVLDPLSESRDTLDGLHSNTQIPKIIGFQRLYVLTGQERYTAAAQFFWKTVVTKRSFATGGNGDNEHFFPPAQFQRHVNSAKTMETCCSHNMLKLTRSLFTMEPTAEYADYYERTLYNAILASQDPDSGMMTYFQSTRPGYLKLYCTPVDSFWCCTGTGMENHSKYGDSIYFHATEKGADSLYVNLFIPSTVNWKEKGLTVKQTTQFPEVGKTRLEVSAENPAELTLNIRHPSWCAAATVTVNGDVVASSQSAGTFVAVKRVWKSGDVVEVDLPMGLRMEMLPGSADEAAVVYGPIVLAGLMGKEGITPGGDLIVNERRYGAVLNEAVEVPVLVGDMSELVQKIKPGETALVFKSEGLGRPADVTLVPYYRVAHERYNMYWKVVGV